MSLVPYAIVANEQSALAEKGELSYDEPLEEATTITCTACGATLTYGEIQKQSRDVATDEIKKDLGLD